MLDVRRLLVLRAVVDHGSMTAAAGPLGYTAAAVSAHISALERQAGTALLERHPRGVRPTEAGAMLVGHVESIAGRLDRAELDLADLVAVRSGRLRLVCFPTAAAGLLPDAVGAFRRAHPAVEMTLDVRENADCLDLVRDGQHDLAVVFSGLPGQELDLAGLDVHTLLDDPLAVAVPAGHRAARHPSVRIADLAGEDWIRDSSPDPACRELLDHLAGRAGFRPRAAFDASDYTAVGRLVANDVGVALVPGLAADQVADAGVRLLTITPPVVRQVHAVTGARAGPAAEAMTTILIENPTGTRPGPPEPTS